MIAASIFLAATTAATTPFDNLPKINTTDFSQDWFSVPLDHYNK